MTIAVIVLSTLLAVGAGLSAWLIHRAHARGWQDAHEALHRGYEQRFQQRLARALTLAGARAEAEKAHVDRIAAPTWGDVEELLLEMKDEKGTS